MGKILSTITKPVRDFNVEARAHAVISKERPTAAPRYKVDQEQYKLIMKEYPDALQESLKKNEELDKHLKNVFLTSYDPVVKDRNPRQNINLEKPLPLDRSATTPFEYGFHEPKRIPLGKITLRKVLRFISEHHVDSKVNNAAKIAEDYLLPEKTVENILKYFKMYEIYIPTERKVKATFAGPTVLRKQIRSSDGQKLLGTFAKNKKDML
ncbi:hypothetical protein MML48_7g00003167 [Holotrichia oblita]|uniref:Uncharacterized protein n=2 Tax=Holotrichia oblita TaxID=644536 RepID=A0ACB9SSB4_HOLOL|nr:hypothetical protein MML48_7g00012312 [Holotrichia oblita]KAI4458052.1 hypothetical protein MML48_7g00003167 [Holotrichia oblita]